MGLEWGVLSAAVGLEVVLLLVLSLPLPKAVLKNIINLYKRILQPMLAILPFALFQLLDVYWKYEHRIGCTGDHCTTMERDRFEKSLYKAQRNGILSIAAVFCYWILFRIVHYINELNHLEAQSKSVKAQ